MTDFTTRVVLHRAEDKYDELHKQMGKRGFSRTIQGSDGVLYELPHAEYNYEGNATGEQVRSKAKEAAEAAAPSKKHSVLVTQSSGRFWSGLDRA